MTPEDFLALHQPDLAADPARYNLILGLLQGLNQDPNRLRLWSLGEGGACAIQTPGWPVVLGALDRAQCATLAKRLVAVDYPGLVGSGKTALWVAEAATALGARFGDAIPQKVLALERPPTPSGAPGAARPLTARDAETFADWRIAFAREALPQEQQPQRRVLLARAGEPGHWLWTVDDRPVSLASLVRRVPGAGAIGMVYTPPEERGRGYAGAVVAALCERIFAEGRKVACLYVDLRNPASQRCYAKIGFQPLCESWHVPRR